jgi:hypothetical protein
MTQVICIGRLDLDSYEYIKFILLSQKMKNEKPKKNIHINMNIFYIKYQ